MALTSAQLLDQVSTAITAILGGAQSYAINGRSLTRADLRTLREWRKELLAEAARDANPRGSGIRVRGVTPV